MDSRERYERDVRALGERIFELAGEGVPAVFDRRWWSGRALDLAMRNDELKVALFRFVDVLPALRGPREIARHLREYFEGPELGLPSLVQWGLGAGSAGGLVARGTAATVRRNIEALAARFIAGRSPEEALPTLRELWEGETAATVDLLGEAALSEAECDHYQRAYERLIEILACETRRWPEREKLERTGRTALPRAHVSVKVSSLYWKLDPVCHEASVGALVERLVPLFRLAARLGVSVNLDLEQHAIVGITRDAFRRALEAPTLRDWPDAGIVCQAYRLDAEADLESLAGWVRSRGTPVTVRLVKGAYWDTETALAAQAGHRSPVFDHKLATDASYERCARRMLEHQPWLRPAFATHNVRSLAASLVHARDLGVPDADLEVQMLYGMAEPLQSAVRALGLRLREYVPVGELIPGMAYLVRRLLENSSNQGFLRASFVERADRVRLLERPRARPESECEAAPRPTRATRPGRFENEPTRDFTDPTERGAFAKAIERVDRSLGQPHKPLALWIAGDEVRTGDLASSLDPARPERVLGTVHQAGPDEVDRAVAAAARAQRGWGSTPPLERGPRRVAGGPPRGP
ncbi:MAG: proline dehydrogenase family protein, partial [Myxococcota bacterium]